MFVELKPLFDMAKDLKEEFNRLDGVQGDGDLGVTVELIAAALEEATAEAVTLKELFAKGGEKVRKKALSTMGILVSFALSAAGRSLTDDAAATSETLSLIQDVMIRELKKRGEAEVGDRTILDAFVPATEAFQAAVTDGGTTFEALKEATLAAQAGAEATRNLVPKTGRASWTGTRGLGEVDGGAWLCYNVYQKFFESYNFSNKGRRESMVKGNIEGIIATMITPFKENEDVDIEAFIKEIHYLLETGVDGISVGGSTGEGAVLTDDELELLCGIAVKEVNGRVPIVGGIIRNSTRQVIKVAQQLEAIGVSALMITPVHYHVNYPGDEGNFEFYQRISDTVNLPIIIYNVVPANSISPALLKRLAEIPNVYGIKQSGGDMHALAAMVHESGEKIKVMSAVDNLLYSTYELGAKGSIVALSAIAPELLVQQWHAYLDGDSKTALAIHNKLMYIFKSVQGANFPSKIKEAIRLQGRPANSKKPAAKGYRK
ncbi:dihydrodipicolinate synthase family protein [Neobacillus sp. PS3-12]|uniref:dihydrodipicolinate synthase family protein n=1 Tax=Neobacillus sp. PS3-12 TaxID=3070677 RepID=UPI0027E12B68|nr:dihydrodipicolinate synthase family protein [Neobacillus sp. PS3-12]WML54984.1 dihydrodipicolinate synthase family protein [Neobacillus sp. PS3-12]